MKGMYEAKILENSIIADGIYDLWLETEAAAHAKMGQFAAVYTGNPATLLPRPLSICEIFRKKNALRIIYRVEGQGTRDIAHAKAGDGLRILAPLGNGFEIDASHKSFVIAGGGIGVPPLLELAKEIRAAQPDAKIAVYLGFRSAAQVILKKDFEKYADEVNISTDDGSVGTAGNVVDMLSTSRFDAVYGCGPKVMLRHLAKWAADGNMPCYVSLEERMACAIGACLACVAKVKQADGEAHEKVCATGPVFNAKELIWQ